MKKVISMLLTLTLLLSFAATFAVQTGAEEAAETAKAPVFYGFQLTAPADNKQNIRFVSVLTSLEGDAVGYKITADYLKGGKSWTKTVNYKQETAQVYASLLANNAYGAEAVTATALAAELKLSEGKGLLALVIENVPTNIGEITFTVETYVKNGDKTVTSDESYFIVENGVKSSKKVLFREDYNDYTGSTIPGMKNLMTDQSKAPECEVKQDTENGGKYLAPCGWRAFKILDGACLNDATHYTIEFDALNNNGVIQVMFNTNFQTSNLVGKQFSEVTGVSMTRLDVRGKANAMWSQLGQVNGWILDQDTKASCDTNCATAHHYAIDLDKSGDKVIVTVYVDGVKVMQTDKVSKGTYNDIYLIGQGEGTVTATFDNLKVTAGAYLTQKAS